MNFENPLLPELPATFIETIVDTIRHAYRENAAYQDPALGHGEWTYALDNFATIRYLLPERLREQGVGDVQIIEGNNTIRFEWRGRLFFIYKLGRSERDDPWAARPSNTSLAGWLGEQMSLQFPGEEEAEPSSYVFGHYGTLRDGLGAIRLHAVGEASEGRILNWRDWRDLWVADAGTESAEPAAPRPEAVEVPEPALGVKRMVVAERDAAS